MISRFISWIKEIFHMFQTETVKSAVGVDILITPRMQNALIQWALMYENLSPWLKDEEIVSMNLAAAIASEIARSVTIEMKVTLSGGARAKYMQEYVDCLVEKMRVAVEFGEAKGGLIIKPYPSNGGIAWDNVQADNFYPVNFDSTGNITGCVFSEQKTMGRYYFTRLEYHNLVGTTYTIKNLAFQSDTLDTLGKSVPLYMVEAWADMVPEVMIENIIYPLFGYFRVPVANNIDPRSPLSVSCYARAVDYIKQADKIYSGLCWEFESGERAMYVDSLAFQPKKNDAGKVIPGSSGLPTTKRRLYRTLGQGTDIGQEQLFKDWSPEFREASILSGLDAILKKIEFTCGLAFGTLSDPAVRDTSPKTATEINSAKQRSFSTIVDNQKSLQKAIEGALYAADVYITLLGLAPAGKITAQYDFDDSIVSDKSIQFAQDLQVKGQGMMSAVEWRMRNFGETEVQARKMLDWVMQERKDSMELTDIPVEE